MRVDCAIKPDAVTSKEPPAESLKEIVKKTAKVQKPSEPSSKNAIQAPSENTVSILVPASLGICYEKFIIDGEPRKVHTMNINGQPCKVILGQVNQVPEWAASVLSNYIASVAKVKVAR